MQSRDKHYVVIFQLKHENEIKQAYTDIYSHEECADFVKAMIADEKLKARLCFGSFKIIQLNMPQAIYRKKYTYYPPVDYFIPGVSREIFLEENANYACSLKKLAIQKLALMFFSQEISEEKLRSLPSELIEKYHQEIVKLKEHGFK